MAVTNQPIFPQAPNNGLPGVQLTTAMTNTKAFDGTDTAGTALAQVFLAGANGSRVDSVNIHYTSTPGAVASGTTAATVIRFWRNHGGVNTTAANNQFLGEVLVPAQTVVALATSVLPVINLPLSRSIEATDKIYAGSTVAIGGTNCALTFDFVAGDY